MVDWNGLDGASDALTAGQGFEHVGRSPEIIRLEEDVSLGIQSRLTPSALNEDNASPSAPNANLEAQGRQLKPVSFVMGCCPIGRRLVGLRVNKVFGSAQASSSLPAWKSSRSRVQQNKTKQTLKAQLHYRVPTSNPLTVPGAWIRSTLDIAPPRNSLTCFHHRQPLLTRHSVLYILYLYHKILRTVLCALLRQGPPL